MANTIVQVNVTQTVAPTPSKLQKTGAMISQGATTTAPGTKSLITQPSDLTALLQAALPLATLTQVGGLATATLESTTISSGTYDPVTGKVTLTLAADIGVVPGLLADISSVTGTGSFANIEGVQTAETGSTGTTLIFTVAAGLTMTITGGNAAATTGLANGVQFWTTVAGATPAGYDGTVLATVTGTSTFTYAVDSTLTTPATGAISADPPGIVELVSMVTTFFAQGSSIAVYVLEMGAGDAAAGVTYLAAWITTNPGIFYAYLVPRSWADEATFRTTLIAAYEATTSKTYFFTTMSLTNYTNFTTLMKCVFGMIEAAGIAGTEFTCAWPFWVTLHYAPSSTNKVPPLAFTYGFGVTPWVTQGNSATFALLKAAGVNYADTGAEGGISNVILKWGTTMDLRPFNYWYSVDWLQITGSQAIANAVINGSNDPINPLYYNQAGINRLQQVLASVASSGITFGLVLGNVLQTEYDGTALVDALDNGDLAGFTVVNAVPFIPYNVANPSDYKLGVYDGLSVTYTPSRGFESITWNVNVTDFVAQ